MNLWGTVRGGSLSPPSASGRAAAIVLRAAYRRGGLVQPRIQCRLAGQGSCPQTSPLVVAAESWAGVGKDRWLMP